MDVILLVPSPNRATGRTVLRALDDLGAAKAIDLHGAALLERAGDGRWHTPAGTEAPSYRGELTGGAIGAMIELLSGPAGQILGGAAVMLAGSSTGIGHSEDVETILLAVARLISPGTTAVVCDMNETTPEAIDGVLAALGLSGWRMTRGVAEAQLNAALHRPMVG